MNSLFSLLRFVPKNHLSFLVGKLVAIPLPKALASAMIRWFSKRYGVRLEDAEYDVEHYSCLGDFFVRDLKPGLRPIGDGVVSPVDGRVVECGAIEDGRMLQVKGKTFSVQEFLRNDELAKTFENGFYVTLYLAPPDYHHIHAPLEGEIIRSHHVPGKLWPVNNWAVESIDSLFAVNERIITVLQTARGKVCVAKVGACNVGSIRLSYDKMRSNEFAGLLSPARTIRTERYEPAVPVEKGQRLGTFYMGSSVLLLFEPDMFEAQLSRGPIKLGETIGSLR